ncbi:MAG: hypothetical protein C1943_11155 [Halochromatium sp.]|nr:hypothetical protein [Halochromatium sp.]
MEKRYNVILFGIQENKEADEVVQAISVAFSITPDKARALLSKTSGTLIKKNVTAEIAKRYQTALVQAGAKAKYSPSTDSAKKLELTPIQQAKSTCPACGQPLEDEEGKEAQAVCPHCKVVIAKYVVNQQRKDEEKVVRERLERIKHVQQEEQARQRQQSEDEARRKALEDRIRKQLGLPAAINTRGRLISSAALMLFLGVGAGIGVSKLFLGETGKLPPSEMQLSIDMLNGMPALEIPTSTENQQLSDPDTQALPGASPQEQIAALSQTLIEKTIKPITNGSALMSEAPSQQIISSDLSDTATEPVNPATPPPQFTLIEKREDLEWDTYLLEQARFSADLDELKQSQQLAIAIQQPSMRYQALLFTVLGYLRLGQPENASSLLDAILDHIASISSVDHRVAIATGLVPLFVEANQPALATRVLKQTESWLTTSGVADRVAETWARLAWAQAWLGMSDSAITSLDHAVSALDQLRTDQARIEAISQLGKAFAQLSERDQADKILSQGQTLAEAIEQTATRQAALEDLARAWVEIGHLQRAVAIGQAIESPDERDRFLLALLERQALAGHSFGLPSLAEMINSVVDQAFAYALLGRTTATPEIADAHFQHAIRITDRINEPLLTKLALQASIARLQSRTNDKASVALFRRAANTLQQSNLTTAQKDASWAKLAANAARARKLAMAENYLRKIATTDVATATQADLEEVRPIITIMPERRPQS